MTCCVHNIIVGKLWFEYYGTMEITCHQTGYKAVINFKPYSWSNKELHKLDGYIYDNKFVHFENIKLKIFKFNLISFTLEKIN